MKTKHHEYGAFPMSSAPSRGVPATAPYYKQYNDEDVPRPMCGQATLNKFLAVGSQISPGKQQIAAERRSLLASSPDTASRKTNPFKHKRMPYDVTPMDNIYSTTQSKYSQSFPQEKKQQQPLYHPHRSVPQKDSMIGDGANGMIYVPQFNVQKAKQVQAVATSPKPRKVPLSRRLPSVAEMSRDEASAIQHRSDQSSAAASILSIASIHADIVGVQEPKEQPEAASSEEESRAESRNDERVEDMIRSMQTIIMQQEANLNMLGSQNEQYRESMSLFQEHVMNLKKEQMQQRNEIHKLHFERESYEAEASSLRLELQTMKTEIVKAKSSQGGTSWTKPSTTESTSASSSSSSSLHSAPPSPRRQVSHPWDKNGASTTAQRETTSSVTDSSSSSSRHQVPTSSPSPRRPQTSGAEKRDASADASIADAETRVVSNNGKEKQNGVQSVVKRQSVSFGVNTEVELGQARAQERDDLPSNTRWERSRKRSVFHKVNPKNEQYTTPTSKEETAMSSKESRDEAPTKSPTSSMPSQPSSGKCSDLKELQARANELRETVAKMKLDNSSISAKTSNRPTLSSSRSSHSRDGSNSISSSPASFDERKRDAVLRYSRGDRPSYWNSYDLNRNPDEDEHQEILNDDERDQASAI